jgi:hypothetical protein
MVVLSGDRKDVTMTNKNFVSSCPAKPLFRFGTAVCAAFLSLASLAGTASAEGPVNLVYRDEFAVDPLTFDPASGMLTQHFAGNLYLPSIVGGNVLVSIPDDPDRLAKDQSQVAVEGTWVFNPAQVSINFDPSNPPPHTVLQLKPDPVASRIRFAFKDGSVLELDPAGQPTLSTHFALGNGVTSNTWASYDFFFTETTVLLKETAGKGRYAGMVGTYTFHQAVKIVGPNLQVYSRGIALLTLKNP